MNFTKRDLARAILTIDAAAENLLPFVEYTHANWQTVAHHRKICAALEAVERGEIKRLLIEAPPRHSKSELASRRFPAWWIGRNPEHQIISASYNDEIGTDIGRDVRNIAKDRLYNNVFPGVTLAEDSKAAGRWHTNRGGSYLATGVGGTMTGYGAHLMIIDDPIKNREEADSERTREKVWAWFTSTVYTRSMPGGAIVMIVTRWHEDDLAARVQKSEPWTVLKLPAISGDPPCALWPEWYPLRELLRIKSVIPPRDWFALYQQEPRVDIGTYCKREWFNARYDVRPKDLRVYIVSDFAITEAREGRDPDFTEHGVFGVAPDSKVYVLDWWSGQTTTDVWLGELVRLIKAHRPACWFGEGGVVGKAIQPILDKTLQREKAWCRTERLSPIRDKAARGRAFQAMAAQCAVLFPRTDWAERVVSQCVSFPGGQHDDAFDVCAWMCLAIDQAHPATALVPVKRTPRRDYEEPQKPGSWRTV